MIGTSMGALHFMIHGSSMNLSLSITHLAEISLKRSALSCELANEIPPCVLYVLAKAEILNWIVATK